jgi:orotate phosphoribosyltransferase
MPAFQHATLISEKENLMTRAASRLTTVVSVIPRDVEHRVLVLQQWGSSGLLVPSCPGGRVETGETHASAFARESLEELGISIVRDLTRPDYQVELEREDGLVVTSVFEQLCPEYHRELKPRDGDKVQSANWLSRDDALAVFLRSPSRHIAEPLINYLGGQVRHASWRYDADSSHIAMSQSKAAEVDACVPGHFQIRDVHTERLGVPAQYLIKPSALDEAASGIATLIKPYKPASLVSPALGGIALASAAAIKLDLPLSIVERGSDGRYSRSRGAPFTTRTALIDSTYHSGATVTAMLDFVREMGGEIITSAVAVKSLLAEERSSVGHGIPVHALETILVHAWQPDSCPLCRDGVQIDRHPARYERKNQ